MPRYFFHLRDGVDVLLDPEGIELAVDVVPAAALKAARDCLAHDAREGRLDLDQRIVVEDEAGAAVHTIEFMDAFEISLPPTRPPVALRALD